MDVRNIPVFLAIVAVEAFFLASLFLDIFEFSATSILFAFVIDSEVEGSK